MESHSRNSFWGLVSFTWHNHCEIHLRCCVCSTSLLSAAHDYAIVCGRTTACSDLVSHCCCFLSFPLRTKKKEICFEKEVVSFYCSDTADDDNSSLRS